MRSPRPAAIAGPTRVAAALLLLACASPLHSDALERRLTFIGHSALGPGADFAVVSVSADSPMMAWTLIASAKVEGTSAEARRVEARLRAGSRGPANVVVGGPFPALTRQVVVDAFSLNRAGALPGLNLVLVGGDELPPEIRVAAERVGARVSHRPMP